MFLTIHLFQYVIFISQNVILKWQFKVCIQAVLNYMHGVLLRKSGENWMLAAALLSASEKFRCVILTTNLCASAVYRWHLKYFSNKTGQEIILFPMCELINVCLQFWISTKCFFLGSEREITIHGAKFFFLCHVYFRTCGMGSKARLPFPGGTEAGFRGDFIYCLY